MTPERDEPLSDDEPTPLVADPNSDGDDDRLTGDDLIAMGLYPPWPTAAEKEAEAKRSFIEVDRGLAEMAAATWRAIGAANDPPRLYRHGSALAWIADAPARIQLLNPTLMRHHLAQIATFRSWERHGERTRPLPPDALVADLLAVPHPGLPALTRLVRSPVFAANGELVTDNGYHRASGLYLAKPVSLQIPPIADHPSAAMIKEARELLVTDWLGDFPFVSAADCAHAVALLLTPLVRECIEGGVPLFVVSKPTPGSGATLLVRSASLILEGAAIAAGTFSANGEEMRKRITAILLHAPSMVLFDNVPGRLVSAPLSAALTTTEWGDRLLGQSRYITLPQRSTFVVTGNNPTSNTELARRTVLIRLDAQVEEPWARTGFRHADLEGWVTRERGALLGAALTLVRAWQAAGSPRAEHAPFGSFDPWADIMAGVLAVAEIPGLLDNRDELFATADDERAQLHAFLAAWWDASGAARVTVATLYPIAKAQDLDIAARSAQAERVRLGRLLLSLRDRRFVLDGLRLTVRTRGAFRGSRYWQLEQIKDHEGIEGMRGGAPPAAPRLPSAGKASPVEGKRHPSPPQPPHPLSDGLLASMREHAQRLRREMADEWANE